MTSTRFYVVFLFVLILFLAGCTGQTQQGSTSGQQTAFGQNTQSQQPSCRMITEQQPYYEQECQSIPYTDRECENVELKYTRGDTRCYTEGWLGDWRVSSCTVTNLDDEEGTFEAFAGLSIDGQKIGDEESEKIYPLQSHTFEYKLKASGSGCYCYLTKIPTKEECRDVLKTRQECNTVTRYRTVEREVCD